MLLNKNEYIVDRVEEDFIIIMDSLGNTMNVSKEKTLGNVKDGDIVVKCNSEYKILNKKGNRYKVNVENNVKVMWEE